MEILAITNNLSSDIKLIACQTIEEALLKMRTAYEEECRNNQYDYNNTYIDEIDKYAQVIEGFKQVEYRIGTVNEVI